MEIQRQYSNTTKLKIFNSCIKSLLLYGSETWKISQNIMSTLQIFMNRSLRKIMRILWPMEIEKFSVRERDSDRESDVVQNTTWREEEEIIQVFEKIYAYLYDPVNKLIAKKLLFGVVSQRKEGFPTWAVTLVGS